MGDVLGGLFGGSKTPAYVNPPMAPPAANPATLASSSVASSTAQQQRELGAAAYGGTIGTSTEGVNPSSVNTAKNNLLGGTQ